MKKTLGTMIAELRKQHAVFVWLKTIYCVQKLKFTKQLDISQFGEQRQGI
jgi:hypothetical protein